MSDLSRLASGVAVRLDQGLAALGVPLPGARRDQLLAYLVELQKWNAAYNLTAVRDPLDMVARHLLDALALVPLLPADARMLDVGSGAGVPGLVLAIARPELKIAVLDSNGKKARFLRHAVRTLGLEQVQVIESRAEDHRPVQAYTHIVSRAFASLADFTGCTRQALAVDGRWLAMKGKVTDEERAALPPDMIVESVQTLTVPGLAEARCVVVIRAAA